MLVCVVCLKIVLNPKFEYNSSFKIFCASQHSLNSHTMYQAYDVFPQIQIAVSRCVQVADMVCQVARTGLRRQQNPVSSAAQPPKPLDKQNSVGCTSCIREATFTNSEAVPSSKRIESIVFINNIFLQKSNVKVQLSDVSGYIKAI